jgi:hypothetical protein
VDKKGFPTFHRTKQEQAFAVFERSIKMYLNRKIANK